MSQHCRKGEEAIEMFRNRRCFKQDDYWYYSTREGVNIGPFDSHEDAETGALDFIAFIGRADPRVVETLKQYRPQAA